MITVMRLLFALGLALMAAMRDAVSCIDVGNDVIKCRLEVVQDVSLEVGSINYNYLEWLMLADLPDYPLKRSLLQFEDLPATDGCETLLDANMYIYYVFAIKPSADSVDKTPWQKHEAQVHTVLQPWDEEETTSLYRLSGVKWGTQYLGLDGVDADPTVIGSNTMNIGQPASFYAFEVTTAVDEWFFQNTTDNNGVLLKVEDEDLIGRDIRFYSNAYEDSDYHAFITLTCTTSA